MNSKQGSISGPLYDAIHKTLCKYAEYRQFRHGRLLPQAFQELVDRCSGELVANGVLLNDLPFIKRIPSHSANVVREIVRDLLARKILPPNSLDPYWLISAFELAMTYDHGPYKTYIYPEEGLLLAALAGICAPTNVIVLGAFYGYWAQWLIPTVAENSGRITLVDPDEECCAVAIRNRSNSCYAEAVEIVTSIGEDYLVNNDDFYDFLILDAEAPRDSIDPQMRGKGVYASLLRACLPRLTEDAVLVCHNILLNDSITRDLALGEVIERNREELGPFMQLVNEAFDFFEYATTEGVGIGRRRPSR